MIHQLAQDYPVAQLCRTLEVARSGYYHWRGGHPVQRVAANAELLAQIKQIHEAKKGTYGSPRMTEHLQQSGQKCNHKRVERLMRQQGLRGKANRRRQVRTTLSDHDQPIAPNLLRGRPAPRRPDEVWVADITYIPTAQGWLYLAGVMDLYTRQIIGWSLWENLHAGGPLQALGRALAQRRHPRGVIHHSDRGLQYACRSYRQALQEAGCLASMSRKGNCYDNAAMEAFWSTLKREALQESASWTHKRVRQVVFEYIESIYNRNRLHSALGYRSPVDFEHQKP